MATHNFEAMASKLDDPSSGMAMFGEAQTGGLEGAGPARRMER